MSHIYSVDGSSDAAICCEYCSDVMKYEYGEIESGKNCMLGDV